MNRHRVYAVLWVVAAELLFCVWLYILHNNYKHCKHLTFTYINIWSSIEFRIIFRTMFPWALITVPGAHTQRCVHQRLYRPWPVISIYLLSSIDLWLRLYHTPQKHIIKHLPNILVSTKFTTIIYSIYSHFWQLCCIKSNY